MWRECENCVPVRLLISPGILLIVDSSLKVLARNDENLYQKSHSQPLLRVSLAAGSVYRYHFSRVSEMPFKYIFGKFYLTVRELVTALVMKSALFFLVC